MGEFKYYLATALIVISLVIALYLGINALDNMLSQRDKNQLERCMAELELSELDCRRTKEFWRQ